MKVLPSGALMYAALLTFALISQAVVVNAQEPSAQQDGQVDVLRLDTDLVQVRAVVTDRKGQLVDNLKKEDFEILENGQPQVVSFFSIERVTGNAATTTQTTEGPGSARRDTPPARNIILLVDNVHMTPSTLFRVKKQLRRFVDKMMTDRDMVALVPTSGTLGILQQFTSDRPMLRYAIDRLTPFLMKTFTAYTPGLAAGVLNGSEEAIQEALVILHDEEGYVPQMRQAGEAYAMLRAREILAEEDNLRRTSLGTLEALSERLATMKGQRMIAFVSDGFTNYDREGGGDLGDFERVISRAVRSGVMIYSLYAMGLVARPDPLSTGMPDEAAQNTLRDMAGETGGRAFINTNDIGGSLEKMLDENSIHYSLAYYPPKGGDERKFRKITLRLKNHPEYSVRTQQGYLPSEKRLEVAAATPQEKLFKAMLAPLPTTTINVEASADFLEREADDSKVTLRVHFDADALQYERSGEDYLLNCQVVVAIIDKAGKLSENFAEGLKGKLTPEEYERAKRNGYFYSQRLSMKPGIYSVRVGVREVVSNFFGTANTWTVIPDLRAGKLALSSLFLGKEREEEGGHVNVSSEAKTQGFQPKLIIGRAIFKSGDTLFYRFIAYNPREVDQQEPIMMKVDVVQGESLVYKGEWQPLSARAIRRDKKGVEAGGQLRLGFVPGIYTLRVTIKDSRSKKTVQQEADFDLGGG